MRNCLQTIALKTSFQFGLPNYHIEPLGPPVRSALTMEYQNRKSVLRKFDLTAMVFEETASHKPLSSATWTDRSALVPKRPAPALVSKCMSQMRCAQTKLLNSTVSQTSR